MVPLGPRRPIRERECGGVDGQVTQTHEAQGLGRDAFRCDFIGGLLSRPHSDEKKKSKKEVEDEMEILQQSLGDGGGGRVEGGRMGALNGKSCHSIYKTEEETGWIGMSIG